MKEANTATINNPVYYRIIAVWVVCEAMLGGIIHGLKIPVSGLIVGSCAVVCISLIAWYAPSRGAILKATLVVAIFKMMLSPQAPPPAYIAVFFQGLLGELLFVNKRWFRVSCLLLASLALLESSLQRILVLTIVYGNGFWKVLNDFIGQLTGQQANTNYSLLIGIAYVTLHLITGWVVGWWASSLPSKIAQWKNEAGVLVAVTPPPNYRSSTKKRKKILLFTVWMILTALYMQSCFEIGKPLLPASAAVSILLRSIIIVFAWAFLAGPLLRTLLHRWLENKKEGRKKDIAAIAELLPATEMLLAASWKSTANSRGLARLEQFARKALVNTLSPRLQQQPIVYMLTGPIRSGKTTSLVEFCIGRDDVYGIVTPVAGKQRFFRDVNTGEEFPMEAASGETGIISVGRYHFSEKNFKKAIAVLERDGARPGWLIIDEIGPLELRGAGFAALLQNVLRIRKSNLLLVVREGLASQVRNYFSIQNSIEIRNVAEIEIAETVI